MKIEVELEDIVKAQRDLDKQKELRIAAEKERDELRSALYSLVTARVDRFQFTTTIRADVMIDDAAILDAVDPISVLECMCRELSFNLTEFIAKKNGVQWR